MRLALTAAALLTLTAAPPTPPRPAPGTTCASAPTRPASPPPSELRNVRVTAYGDTFQSVTVSSLEGVYKPAT
jgi:hypothetical protein